jgi:beta-1,2-mannobiose phosphorylase / 1,2-beta-oligomannan phosphorylase
MPKLLEARDFLHFKIMPFHGEIVRNNGMVMFPRKINGKFAMLCRLDSVNNYISYYDKITIWREAKLIQQPKFDHTLCHV